MKSKSRHQRRPRARDEGGHATLRLFGLHPVRAALANSSRQCHRLHVTANARQRLGDALDVADVEIRDTETDGINRLVGKDAVHQGAVLECDPLERLDQSELYQLADARLVLVLDQVTDPHNVGAILRSAVALAADAVLVTARNAPPETGTLAKSASGALDHIVLGELRNVSKALATLNEHGFVSVGLDSDGVADMTETLEAERPERIALVLGAEGRGLRQGTREACTHLARLDMPGAIRSLNVSNAAALALYIARKSLDAK